MGFLCVPLSVGWRSLVEVLMFSPALRVVLPAELPPPPSTIAGPLCRRFLALLPNGAVPRLCSAPLHPLLTFSVSF